MSIPTGQRYLLAFHRVLYFDHCFFLMFINDSVNEIGSCIRLFSDDTSLFIIVDDHVSPPEHLNADLIKILQWAETWLVTLNPNKAESSHKISKPIYPSLYMRINKYWKLTVTINWVFFFRMMVHDITS